MCVSEDKLQDGRSGAFRPKNEGKIMGGWI